MKPTTTIPKDEKEWLRLRALDITSTEVSALFGLSPYTTEFELWHRKKKGQVLEFEMNERMTWGIRLQDAIAKGIAQDQGWTVRRMEEYMSIEDYRIGSSFDFKIEGPNTPGLLEIKNVDSLIYKQGWEVDGDDIEAPPHIELQVQHQLLVSRLELAYIGAFVGGNKVVLLKREPDQEIHEAILNKARKFWESIESGVEPKPDFEKDAKFIAKLYGYAEPGKVMDLREDSHFTEMALQHRALGDEIKELESKRDALKAEMLMIIGDSEKATADGFSVSAGLVAPAHIEYDRAGYRAFKLNWPRAKKEK